MTPIDGVCDGTKKRYVGMLGRAGQGRVRKEVKR